MADRTISELTAATAVQSADLFVLEQNNTAKKLTGQILENWLVSFADGHGGVQSFVKVSSSGTNPVVDTWRMTYADETYTDIPVTNGVKGETGAQTYVWIKWAAQQPTADNQMSNDPDDWIGIYSGTASTAPATYTSYKWYQYKGDTGNNGYAVDEVTWGSNSGGGNVPGVPGTTDTYNMYLDDPNATYCGSFTVYNGADGQGSPGSQTPLVDSGSGVVGTANAFSREDHQHPLNVDSTNPANLGTAAPGSAATYARRDHVHKMPSYSDVGAQRSALKFTNTSVATSAFVSDSTYASYGYRAAVTLTGATATMIPEVAFGIEDAASGIFATGADTYDGGVYIYAKEVPSAAITIPTILLWR